MKATPSNGGQSTCAIPTSRLLWTRLAVLTIAVATGLALQHVLREHLTSLDALARTDPIGARRQFATELRVGGFGLFSVTGALGGWLMAISARGVLVGRFPPSGVSSWAVARTASGPAARRLGIFGLFVGSLLVCASSAGAVIVWKMALVLLACRAT